MDIREHAILGIDGIEFGNLELNNQYRFYIRKNGNIGFEITPKSIDVEVTDSNLHALECINNAKEQFDSSGFNRETCMRIEDDIPLIKYLSSYTIKEVR